MTNTHTHNTYAISHLNSLGNLTGTRFRGAALYVKANLSINWRSFGVSGHVEGEGAREGEVGRPRAALNVRDVPGPPGLGGQR